LPACCWGCVIVGEDAIQRCIGRLRKVSAEIAAFEIGTVNRVGCKFTVRSETALQAPIELGQKRSTAVLDFRIAHGDGDDAIFAECLTDDICAALAAHRDMAVVTRAVSSVVMDNIRNVSGIGAMLKTRYAAGGSIRPSSAGRSITIQLFGTETAQILWSHQRDEPVADSYPSDELLLDLTGRLVVHIMNEESDRQRLS
jgi:TolB-like protein